ncbi:MAG: keto-deoxy-phosphogluconate aldolase [Kangiella sp.]|nr:MAG: keto-deoxy-phosphogluconate aldolase [Kangiella sp.]
MTYTTLEIMQQSKVIPVVVINNLEDAVPLANALVDGGLNVLEITLRTSVAIEAIKQIKISIPNAIVGTGTVIDLNTFNASLEANVDFIVSPGTTDELLNAVAKQSIPLLPGVNSPSEVMKLLSLGFTEMKFFPAEAAGGVNMLKSIAGPLPQVTFCPTGGINLNNANDYLALSNVTCVGGTWMLDKQLIAEKNWNEISRLAKQASEL